MYSAPRVIVSVPLGVIQYGNIAFEPKLPDFKVTAIAQLGMGLLNKITLL
jgi:monoamine oxidase